MDDYEDVLDSEIPHGFHLDDEDDDEFSDDPLFAKKKLDEDDDEIDDGFLFEDEPFDALADEEKDLY